MHLISDVLIYLRCHIFRCSTSFRSITYLYEVFKVHIDCFISHQKTQSFLNSLTTGKSSVYLNSSSLCNGWYTFRTSIFKQNTDANDLIRYLKVTAGETPFLIREPDEISLTPEQEEHFIEGIVKEPRELMLIGTVAGEHVGNCSLMSLGNYERYAHRCSVAIALYQKYRGLGIGREMLKTVLTVAKQCGYEQAELEVVSTNTPAIRLYESLGFEIWGTQPHSVRYRDGSYADDHFMVKRLV